MRHSAITFAEQVHELIRQGQSWDLIFCSDMLNLAEFKGLAPKQISKLPVIAYFHENQLTYPVQFEDERDYQFGMTNITTALAATKVWFNSWYHLDSFLDAVENFLKKMPDYQPENAISQIKENASVHYPGIKEFSKRSSVKSKRLRILYSARWEHDKNPEDFFQAMEIVKNSGVDFELNVIGEQFREIPKVFNQAKKFFKDNINRWGYQENQAEYDQALAEADIVVSTAKHEFFGISIVEAIAAGAYPLLPQRLAYPEVIGLETNNSGKQFFYDGTIEDLSRKIISLAQEFYNDKLWTPEAEKTLQKISRFYWTSLAPALDNAIDNIATL